MADKSLFIEMSKQIIQAFYDDDDKADALLDKFKSEWQALPAEEKEDYLFDVLIVASKFKKLAQFLRADQKEQQSAIVDKKPKEEPNSPPAIEQAAVAPIMPHPRYDGIPRAAQIPQDMSAHEPMPSEDTSSVVEKNLHTFLQKSNQIKRDLTPGENHLVHRNPGEDIPHTLVYVWDEPEKTHQAYIIATTQDKPALHLSLHHDTAPYGRDAKVKSIFPFNIEADMKPILSGQPSPLVARRVHGSHSKLKPGEINVAEITYGSPIPVVAYDNRKGQKKYMELLPRARGHSVADIPTDGQKSTVLEFFQMVRACLEAVRDFHAQGFVHRDLHEGNLFYSKEDDIAQLVDFDFSELKPEIRAKDILDMAKVIYFIRANYAPPECGGAEIMLSLAYSNGRIQDRDLLPEQRLQLSLDALCMRMGDTKIPHEQRPTAEEALKELDTIYATFAKAPSMDISVEENKGVNPSPPRPKAVPSRHSFFAAAPASSAVPTEPSVIVEPKTP